MMTIEAMTLPSESAVVTRRHLDKLCEAVWSARRGSATAQTQFAELRSLDDVKVWGLWGLLAAIVSERRWDAARTLLGAVLEPTDDFATELVRFDAVDGRLPSEGNPGWRIEGGGSAYAHGGMLRLVGLGGQSARFELPLPELDNLDGTWVEFVAARGSRVDGDCRLECSDGSVTETVYLDDGTISLASTGVATHWPTDRPQVYGLLMTRQTARLYANGQCILQSDGLAADHARHVRFGVYASENGADSESHWYFLRVSRLSQAATTPRCLPPAWPTEVWQALTERCLASESWEEALEIAIRGRHGHPADPDTGRWLAQVFEQVARQEAAIPLIRRTLHHLQLSDRAAVTEVCHEAVLGDPLLVADGLGVQYARSRASWPWLRQLGRALLGRPNRRSDDDHFWAIRDVSLTLREGDMLGIIGRNGAGKSTLLRTLADLIEPSAGTVRTFGKSILLSVGTGFLAPLTGRENIYLAGLYLGMTRREIDERFDEIVEFAEIWDALDRPLHTYSSGMRSRLQFAVATTISPEVLMLDELLGAGDAGFGDKARPRMQRLLRRARAVVLVTHDTHFVRNNCTQAIVLEDGRVVHHGAPDVAVALYHDMIARRPKRAEREVPSLAPDEGALIVPGERRVLVGQP